MNRHDHERFDALHERVASGIMLTASQRAEYDALLSRYPELGVEAALLDELSNMDARPSSSSRALAEAALAHLATRTAPEVTCERPDPVGEEGVRDGAESAREERGRKGRDNRKDGELRDVDAHDSAYESHELPLHSYSVLRLRGLSTRRSIRPLWVTGSALATAAAAALYLFGAQQDTGAATRAELVFTSGEVTVERHALTPAPSAQAHAHTNTSERAQHTEAYGRLLQTGEVVAVEEGHACFVLDPGISVCLDRQTRLRIDQLDGGRRRFELQSGRVALDLDHQPRGFDVTVVAADVESTAIGTSFSVSRTGNRVQTSVLEGTVRVQQDGNADHDVHAHQSLTLEGTSLTRNTLTRGQEAPAWAVLDVRRLWREQAAATLHIDGEPRGAEVWLDGQFIGRIPVTTLAPSGRRQIVVRNEREELLARTGILHSGQRTSLTVGAAQEPHEDARARGTSKPAHAGPAAAATSPRHGASMEPARRSTGRVRPRPRTVSPSNIPSSGPASTAATGPTAERYGPSAAALQQQAQHLLRDRRFVAAAERYRRLRHNHPNSNEARTALVTLAQIELEHGKGAHAALELLQTYLGGGEGAVSPEARYLRIQCLGALKQTNDELSAIDDFLHRYPHSLRAPRLLHRRAQLGTPVGVP